MSILIQLQQLTKIYHSGDTDFLALNKINLTVMKGEMLSIMGASGSGKSTLMTILGLLDRPTEGKYLFNDQSISELTDTKLAKMRNQKIGFVFQSFFLLPRMTALQNVMLPLFYRNCDKKIATEKALYLLEKVSMQNFAHRKPNQLSGGQQQRVAIARALVGDADIILADEPTGALDSKTGNEVMELFHALNTQEKRTLVIITHDEAVAKQCKRTIYIKDGCIIV